MRRGKISLFFILFLGLGGCASQPRVDSSYPIRLQNMHPRDYMDLRYPIYLITDPSFFFGCEKGLVGSVIYLSRGCMEDRVAAVRNGVNDWLKHFAEPTRPQVIIVESRDYIPSNARNTPISLRLETRLCDRDDGEKKAACYSYRNSPDLATVFDSKIYITTRIFAHEFGHALGYGHNNAPEGGKSIMRSSPIDDVSPIDIKILCQIHSECPAHEEDW